MGKKLFANLLDEMIVFGVSVIILFIFEGILKALGYVTKQPGTFLAIFMFVLNVLYFPIIENSKYGSTLGRRIMKLDAETVELNKAEENKKEDSIENKKEETATEEAVEEKTEDKE